MSAPPRISTQEIVNALIRWRGVVSHAAESLGMNRDSLYDRIERLGLDLEGFRNSNAKAVMAMRRLSGMSGIDSRHVGNEQHSTREGFPSSARTGKVGRMQPATTEDTPAPIRAVVTRPRAVRLRPEFMERLREAKLDALTRYRTETDENAILDQFFEEAFEGWLRSKLEPKPESKRRRSEGGTE